jgi:hypothetical protein
VVLKLCSLQEKSYGKMAKGNYSIITPDKDMVLVHCTSSYCAGPLYEVVLNANWNFSNYALDKETYQRAIIL